MAKLSRDDYQRLRDAMANSQHHRGTGRMLDLAFTHIEEADEVRRKQYQFIGALQQNIKMLTEQRRQSRMHSVAEAVVNTAVGFGISWAVWVWIVAPLFNIPYHHGQGLAITMIFTVTSLIRSYVLRRIFNAVGRKH